ncbi:hypothetical protein E2C01_009555 [Portunus trituberculatus]|uniref:Uncharacterized protein n=1 Tax=Portunus trituberculatus TaxID=210409 RepID=A0A5B7D622_PORTR|nr:hypothetical protein [Portunus trituberculatus]
MKTEETATSWRYFPHNNNHQGDNGTTISSLTAHAPSACPSHSHVMLTLDIPSSGQGQCQAPASQQQHLQGTWAPALHQRELWNQS